MNPDSQEKIECVRNIVQETTKISPRGPIVIKLLPIDYSKDNIHLTIISVEDQKRILKKLKEDGEIKNLLFLGKQEVTLEFVNINKNKKEEINNKPELLKSLKREILDAKKGRGKPISEIKSYCELYQNLLSFIEKRIGYVSDFKKEGKEIYKLPNIGIAHEEHKEIFKKLIFDLSSKGIISSIEIMDQPENPGIRSATSSRKIIDGKNIIIKDKVGFRQYAEQLRKLIDGIHEKENIKKIEDRIAPTSFMSKKISIPKISPIFIYDTKVVSFINKKKEIILEDITGLSLTLLVYFLNQVNSHISESTIESDIEMFLRKTGELRNERSTFSAINKLKSKLKKLTGKEFLRFVKNNLENTWIFELDN